MSMKTYIIRVLTDGKITLYRIENQITGEIHTTWANFTKAHAAVRDLNNISFRMKGKVS